MGTGLANDSAARLLDHAGSLVDKMIEQHDPRVAEALRIISEDLYNAVLLALETPPSVALYASATVNAIRDLPKDARYEAYVRLVAAIEKDRNQTNYNRLSAAPREN